MPHLPLFFPKDSDLLTCVKESLGIPRTCYLRAVSVSSWALDLDVGPRHSKSKATKESHPRKVTKAFICKA